MNGVFCVVLEAISKAFMPQIVCMAYSTWAGSLTRAQSLALVNPLCAWRDGISVLHHCASSTSML